MKNKYSFKLLTFLIISLLLFLNLIWLSFLIIIIVIIHYSINKFLKLVKPQFLKKSLRASFLILFIFSIAISIKLFTFDIYKIPSSSMEDTLFPGDVIVVNKLKYGPILPRSPFEIPLVNIAFYFNKKARDSMKVNWWDYKRLSGTSTIKNGDVLVYKNFRSNNSFAKRCIGIAGDTLIIEEGRIYINDIKQEYAGTIRNTYRFIARDSKALYRKIDSLKINRVFSRDTENASFFMIQLTYDELNKIKHLKCIDSLHPVEKTFKKEDKLFVKPNHHHWTPDSLGPVVVPKKGMKINLNEETFALYNTTINLHEGVSIKKRAFSYFINGKEQHTYTFKQNYYFMMGDNRKGSFDSRFIGFIPEESIISKVQCVLFSNYRDEFRWDRLFKSVN
ncbi:signal peptidase I [Flavivirga eckloniae]|uniref:Signal peptidase I n=1 Tax=Flavivirga eckloniae TaxID=1803846 RepID=A0A2K9PN58_9FLAO|nr:signal peptidase I [Flavivirga eckloniae]AUP78494.1 signal peptidase I [Flavivirga eckloniae]